MATYTNSPAQIQLTYYILILRLAGCKERVEGVDGMKSYYEVQQPRKLQNGVITGFTPVLKSILKKFQHRI